MKATTAMLRDRSVRQGLPSTGQASGRMGLVRPRVCSRAFCGIADPDVWRRVRTTTPGPSLWEIVGPFMGLWVKQGRTGFAGIPCRKMFSDLFSHQHACLSAVHSEFFFLTAHQTHLWARHVFLSGSSMTNVPGHRTVMGSSIHSIFFLVSHSLTSHLSCR